MFLAETLFLKILFFSRAVSGNGCANPEHLCAVLQIPGLASLTMKPTCHFLLALDSEGDSYQPDLM